MKCSRLARRSVRLFAQNLEERNAPALFGGIDNAVNVGTNPNSVVVADLNADGRLDLAVANDNSNDVTVLVGNGSGGFSPATGSPFAAGTNPQSAAVGDFNGDGRPDLAVANFGGDVTVLMGNGSGGFAPASGSPVFLGGGLVSVVVADFNGDGRPDLAVADYSNSTVKVLLGNGDGAFRPANPALHTVGTNPISMAVGDFNDDTLPDLAVANASSQDVTVLLGNGGGAFDPAAGSPFATIYSPSSVAIGDFSGDGRPDLAVATNNFFSQAYLELLSGTGSGGFAQTGQIFSTGFRSSSMALADFNGDGRLDVAVTGRTGDSVLLAYEFGGFNSFGVPADSPISVVVGDFNGDGLPDLVNANFQANDVTINLNHGATTTTLSSSNTHTVYGQSYTLTATVSAASGLPVTGNVLFTDGTNTFGPVAIVNGRVSFSFGASNPTIVNSSEYKAILMGSAEYFTSTSEPVTVDIAPAPTTAVAIGPSRTPVAGQQITLTAIVTAASPVTPTGTVTFLDGGTVLGTAPLSNGVATLPWKFKTTGVHQFCVQYRETDFNFVNSISPLTPIAVVGTAQKFITGADAGGSPLVKVYNLDGTLDRSFLAFDSTFKGGVRVAKGDVNGDGVDDIIVAPGSGMAPIVKVYDGYNGSQIRAFYAYPFTFKGGVWVAAGDVNGDGFADIIVAPGSGASPHVRVISGKDNTELFNLPPYPATFRGGVRVAAGDLDGDGKADIICSPAKGAGQNVRVFNAVANPGTGTHDELFNIPTPFGAKFSGGIFVAAGDVTGDGRADLIVSSGSGIVSSVKVFDGKTHNLVNALAPFDTTFKGGVRVATGDVNGDGYADIIVAAGAGGGPLVRVFSGKDGSELLSFMGYDPTFIGGVFVG